MVRAQTNPSVSMFVMPFDTERYRFNRLASRIVSTVLVRGTRRKVVHRYNRSLHAIDVPQGL
jgi:hypothetical protein